MKGNRVGMFNDPTPNSFINIRYVYTMIRIAKENTDFSPEEFENFVGELALIAWKMVAVWRHLDKYIETEDGLIELERSKSDENIINPEVIDYSQELFYELDGFLVQMKSTLDYLAKFPTAIIGSCWPQLHFSKKGKVILDALANNLPDEFKDKAPLVESCIKEHQPWLEMAIEARDIINHRIRGGFAIESSIVMRTIRDGEERIYVPMWTDEMTVRRYMEIVWNNLFVLIEQFSIGFLFFRFRPALGIVYNPEPIGSPISPIIVLPEGGVEPTLQILNFIKRTTTSK